MAPVAGRYRKRHVMEFGYRKGRGQVGGSMHYMRSPEDMIGGKIDCCRKQGLRVCCRHRGNYVSQRSDPLHCIPISGKTVECLGSNRAVRDSASIKNIPSLADMKGA